MNNWYIPVSLRSLASDSTRERAYDIFTNLRNKGVDELVAVRITNTRLKEEGLDTTRVSKEALDKKEPAESMVRNITKEVLQPQPPKPNVPKIIQPQLGLGGIWDD
ncbi:MAG: hypothetical protein JHC33_02050 [Ignisphaera sp.]|nr:hypothetical protein [Ignisphaera sp.]